jgi:hypothetical protein
VFVFAHRAQGPQGKQNNVIGNNNNNNNHGSTALYGLGPPLSEVTRAFCASAAVRDRLTGRAFQLDPDVTARAIWQSVRRLE